MRKRLSHVGKSLQQVNDRAAGATGKLEEPLTELKTLSDNVEADSGHRNP